MSDIFEVHLVLPDGDEALAGRIIDDIVPGRQQPSVSFEYDPSFLANPDSYALSPELPLVTGFQAAPLNRTIFTAFADAMPDAWGKRLLNAERRRIARETGTRWSPPSDLDMLLMVSDATRQGALRFRVPGEADYLTPAREAVPELVDLGRLVNAAEQFENGNQPEEALRVLVGAGSTQGGARPKTAVIDGSGSLAIAKLPHPDDRWDVGGWEGVTLTLAARAGIAIPAFEMHRVSEHRTVLVVRRFDRDGERRIGYLSARSLLLAADGDAADYVTIAEHLGEESAAPAADGAELFRRAAFAVLVNNVDDHLRNHGILRGGTGWALSPAFDMNPFPLTGSVNSTPLTAEDDPYNRDIRLLVDAASSFRVARPRSLQIIAEVADAITDWAAVAREAGIAPDPIQAMGPAFDNVNTERVRFLLASHDPRR